MECRIFSAMMIGPRGRQEDAITDGTTVFQADFLTRKKQISCDDIMIAVCDGMGGHDAGEIASMFVCEKLTRVNRLKISAGNILESLARIQRDALVNLPRNSGTTVAGILANTKKIIAFNAGDSRVYRLTPDAISYISHDHSLVQEMVDQSIIEAENLNTHPLRNVIELGIGPAFKNSWNVKKIFTFEASMEIPSHYLLCTDGLTDIISEREIYSLLMPDPIENGTRLYNTLRQRKLRDNTSFIIMEIR